MENIKLVVFDLDGTIVNAYPAIVRSFNYTMRSLKLPTQEALVIRRAVGWGDKNLLRPFIKAEDLAQALSIYRRHHRLSLLTGARLFPNAERVLTYLKNKGYKLAVASNRPTRFSWILIRHLKLDRYFRYVLCADRLKNIKPHPEILDKIMQRFKALPQQTIYIGDMVIDAQAGRRAGVKTVIVTTGSSTKQEIAKENSYRIIPQIKELLKIL